MTPIVTIKPDLLRVLKEAQNVFRTKASQGDQRALSAMLATARKRKRREAFGDEITMETDIVLKKFKY